MQIPNYTNQQLPVKQLPDVPLPNTEKTNQALSNLGGALTDVSNMVGQKMREAREEVEFTNAVTDTMTKYDNFKLELSRNPNYQNYNKLYDDFAKKTTGELNKGFASPNVRDRFNLWFEEKNVQFQSEVKWDSQKKEIADLRHGYEYGIEQAVNRGDIVFVLDSSEAAIQNGIISRPDANTIVENARHQMAYNTAYRENILLPVEEAEKKVADPSNYPTLSDRDRTEIIQRLRSEDAVKREREHREWMVRNDKAYNFALRELTSKTLTVSNLLDSPNYVDLTPEEREHFIDELTAKGKRPGEQSDPAYEHQVMMMLTNPEKTDKEVTDFVRQGLKNWLLSNEDTLKYLDQTKTRKPNYGLNSSLGIFDQMEKDGLITPKQKVILTDAVIKETQGKDLSHTEIMDKAKEMAAPFKEDGWANFWSWTGLTKSKDQQLKEAAEAGSVVAQDMIEENLKAAQKEADKKLAEKSAAEQRKIANEKGTLKNTFADWLWTNDATFRAEQARNNKTANPIQLKQGVSGKAEIVYFSSDPNDYGIKFGDKYYKKQGNNFIQWYAAPAAAQAAKKKEATPAQLFTQWKGKPESVSKNGNTEAYYKGGVWYTYEDDRWKRFDTKENKWVIVKVK